MMIPMMRGNSVSAMLNPRWESSVLRTDSMKRDNTKAVKHSVRYSLLMVSIEMITHHALMKAMKALGVFVWEYDILLPHIISRKKTFAMNSAAHENMDSNLNRDFISVGSIHRVTISCHLES